MPETTSHQTFRDPAGSLELKPDGAYRRIAAEHAADCLRFLASDLSRQLVADGHVIGTEILDGSPLSATVHLNPPGDRVSEGHPLYLRHPLVSFISYPWEWSPQLWLLAAKLTLDLADRLLREGWTLKDATPLNVLFEGCRPVFVDLLSIEASVPGRMVWLPYGQFVRTFILPMLVHARLGWPLSASMMRRDGFEPEEVYRSLRWSNRLRRPALAAVTLPVLFASRGKGDAFAAPLASSKPDDPELTMHVLRKTFAGLREQMKRAMPLLRSSAWAQYTTTATHYDEADHAAKRAFVEQVLDAVRPSRVLDVGCNTGVYSKMAAAAGAAVVSIDSDLEAVDRLAVSAAVEKLNILPLCVDLTHPTPAVGWRNQEQLSFLSRCEQYFDLVLMLAVIHHLLLSSQVPLDRIAALCASITTKWLILEWVPPSDPKFKELLRGRDAIYAHLTETAFRSAFAVHFDVEQELQLENGRILFHFSRRRA